MIDEKILKFGGCVPNFSKRNSQSQNCFSDNPVGGSNDITGHV